MGERALGVPILVSLDMPKSDCYWVAEFSGVADGAIHVVVIIGGIVRPSRSCIAHRVDIRNDTLVIAEALESGAFIVGSIVV